METATSLHTAIDIRARSGHTTGELFLNRAIDALGVWGGMSHSDGTDDEGYVSIGFDPTKADGGIAAVLAWLDSLDIEYDLTLTRWRPEND